ncbi:MAG: ribonuclease III [Ignavibacteriales bacterium]
MLRKVLDVIKTRIFRFDSTNKLAEIDFTKLSSLLNIKINNKALFVKALTHKSYLDLNTNFTKSNERLEFLGDSILGFVVAGVLFEEFKDKDEGFLTKYRAGIVDKPALAKAAENMGLIDFILFDRRFVKGSVEGVKTISADCMEAMIGAIYLDSGLENAKKFIRRWIINPSFQTKEFQVDRNYKGQLLEYTHANHFPTPIYRVADELGPDHDKQFEIEVIINNHVVGKGKGRSKKSAEQEAAKSALEKIEQQLSS